MPIQPVFANGRLLCVQTQTAEGGEREKWWAALDDARKREIAQRRLYYDGEQYEAENAATAVSLGLNLEQFRLPEAPSRHAYSAAISDGIDYIAGQLAENFAIEMADTAVQELIIEILT